MNMSLGNAYCGVVGTFIRQMNDNKTATCAMFQNAILRIFTSVSVSQVLLLKIDNVQWAQGDLCFLS